MVRDHSNAWKLKQGRSAQSGSWGISTVCFQNRRASSLVGLPGHRSVYCNQRGISTHCESRFTDIVTHRAGGFRERKTLRIAQRFSLRNPEGCRPAILRCFCNLRRVGFRRWFHLWGNLNRNLAQVPPLATDGVGAIIAATRDAE